MTTTEQQKKMEKKAILVTGGNTGIGFALCKQLLLEDNCQVYLGARNVERGKKAVADIQQMCVAADGHDSETAKDIEFVLIDVSNDILVKEAATELKSKLGISSLYGLVNNAGVGIKTGSGCVDELLATNFYGPKRVTDAFVGMIDKEQGRIVNVSSGAASMYLRDQSLDVKKLFTNPDTSWNELVSEVEQRKTEGGSGGTGVYGLSKAALNLVTIQQAKMYAPPIYSGNIVCASISPGFIATQLTAGYNAKLTPEEGTVSIRHCLFSSDILSGYYYGSDGLRSPLTMCRDPGTPAYEGEEESTIDRHKNKYNN